MIRRNPTLIPMGDLDVQDVRDMVAKQKADALATQHLMLKMKRMVENPTMDTDDIQMLQRLKSINDRQDKEKRLGIQPGIIAPG
jgi:hypothetical protein